MAIPATIQQLADNVRAAVYGIDVRESIAKSMEETGRTADDAIQLANEQLQRVNNLIQNNPQPSELVDAREAPDGTVHPLLRDHLFSIHGRLGVVDGSRLHIEDFKKEIPEVDDIPRIQRMAAEATANGISTLVFPDGDYIHQSLNSVVLTGTDLNILATPNARIVTKDGAASRCFILRDANTVFITFLSFLSQTTDPTKPYNALDIQNSSNVFVMFCKFKDYSFYGLSITENTATWEKKACDNIQILFCEFENIGTHALEQFPKVKSQNCFIFGNTFKNCGMTALNGVDGVALKGGQATENTFILNNTFIGGKTALGILNWEFVVASGNTFIDCEAYAVSLTLNTHPSYTANFVFALVTSNTLIMHDDFTPVASYAAFALNGGKSDNRRIIIKDNVVRGWSSAYEIRFELDTPNIFFEDNHFLNMRGTATCDNAKGGVPTNGSFKRNRFENNNVTNNISAKLQGKNMRLEDNEFVRYGDYSLVLTSSMTAWAATTDRKVGDVVYVGMNIYTCTIAGTTGSVAPSHTSGTAVDGTVTWEYTPNYFDFTLDGTKFIEPVANGTAGRGCINGVGSIRAKVLNSFVDNGKRGKAQFLIFASSAFEIVEHGTISLDEALKITQGSTTVIKAGGFFRSSAGKRIFYGSAPPTSGTFFQGDKYINPLSTAGGYDGWNCVAQGVPGIWKGYGQIQT